MSSTVEALEAEALHLSATERGRLIERLIARFEVDPSVDDACAEEVERRNAQIESGAVSLIDRRTRSNSQAENRVPMNYWLHSEAQDDLREAAEFYGEKAGTALSQSSLQEFEHTVSLLLEHPAMFRTRDKIPFVMPLGKDLDDRP